MYDSEIRAALVPMLEGFGVRVVQEWAIGGSVIDLAMITAAHLFGIEIKGPRDSFARLERQARTYGRYFDRLTLVCDEGHATRALAGAVPSWWGVTIIRPGPPVRFDVVRNAELNANTTPVCVAGLLYTRELRAILQRRCLPYRDSSGHPATRAHSKSRMMTTLCAAVALEDFRADVCGMLLARPHWKADGGRRTTGKDTKLTTPVPR